MKSMCQRIGICTVPLALMALFGLACPKRTTAREQASPNGSPRAARGPASPVSGMQSDSSRMEHNRLAIRLLPQLGHSGAVNSVAFSPDGRFVLTGSADRTALLWDARSGAEIRAFGGHSGEVTTVAFSPDGRSVLTGSEDTTARLWDVQTGLEIRSFSFLGHVNSVAFSPNGRYVLIGGAGSTGRASLWDAQSGAEIGTSYRDPDSVTAVAISPDGHFVLTGSHDAVRLWDAKANTEIRSFSVPSKRPPIWYSRGEGPRPNPPRVNSAAFSPDGRFVLTGGADQTARLWDAQTGALMRSFVGHSNEVLSVAFSPDGRFVLTGSGSVSGNDYTAKLWDAQTGAQIRTFSNGGSVASVVFSPDGRYVLIGSSGGASLWDKQTGALVRTFSSQSAKVTAVTFSPDDRFILIGSIDNGARLWDARTGVLARSFSGPSSDSPWSLSVAFSPDSRFVLTGTDGFEAKNNTAKLWNAQTAVESRSFAVPEGVRALAFSPDGHYVLTGGHGGLGNPAQLWAMDTGKLIRSFSYHWDGVFSVAFSPDGRFVLLGMDHNAAKLVDLRTGATIRSFADRASDYDKTIGFEANWERIKYQSDLVLAVAFSPDGRFVLTGSTSKSAMLWDAQTGAGIRSFSGHSGRVTSVAFSRDGRFVLTGSDDYTAKLWNTQTGAEIRSFSGHSGRVTSVAFSRDGGFVLTGSDDSTTRLWLAANGRELCSLISFNDGTWAAVDPEGRFDTNNLDGNNALHWIASDDPMVALPLEVFMRDYYEPRLLGRILAGDRLPPVRSLAEINRVQPIVSITGIERAAGSVDLVTVSVEIESEQRALSRDGKAALLKSGAFDLRLFRDGQIVGQWPEPPILASRVQLGRDNELGSWREQSRIPLDTETGKAMRQFTVRVARWKGVKGVDFTAYAFNSDRVKSVTVHRAFDFPADLLPRKGRAYVITIGVNSYESPAWNLQFAAVDAVAMREIVTKVLREGHDYDAVIPVSLISDSRDTEGAQVATKDNLKIVLDRLAGRSADPEGLMRKAAPEDLVLISFSGHGYADERGNFYLLPHDIGPGLIKPLPSTRLSRLLERSISSDELTAWLRDVDAGDMALVIDACQSASSVGGGFKPGPMGSRGLGQLAYDKRMKILAASQSDEMALEASSTKHGLLTYALIHDGLEEGHADFKPKDKQIRLTEWLQYAVERVPQLYTDLFAQVKGVEITEDFGPSGRNVDSQTPALFDFPSRKSDPVLVIVQAP
jgi:WD40 repeat protein/uncharacterized caspase-like protein